MTKQQIKADWHILEDFPTRDGEYVVCFLTSDGDYGWPDIWEFTSSKGWEPVLGIHDEHHPSHWCNLPMPR